MNIGGGTKYEIRLKLQAVNTFTKSTIIIGKVRNHIGVLRKLSHSYKILCFRFFACARTLKRINQLIERATHSANPRKKLTVGFARVELKREKNPIHET